MFDAVAVKLPDPLIVKKVTFRLPFQFPFMDIFPPDVLQPILFGELRFTL